MKAKKILFAALMVGTLLPASIGSVFATEKEGTTPVTYDNRNYIPDPDNPVNPGWAVTIPSSINFTDDNKIIDTSVELVSINGGTIPTENVTVTVTSENDYQLKKNPGDDAGLSYKLTYGDKIMSDSQKSVAVLNDSVTMQSGTAVLGNDKAPTRGQYTDTLTYTVTK